MISPPVQPGDVLAGKYRVERVLGQGNMGVVVAASHVELAQRVALKFMLAGASAQKEQRERFLREARAVVRLRSQHVARVLDVGTLEGDRPYIVMEFLEGADLAALLKGGPLSFPQAVEYVLQACEAVAEAHAAGIVHRDLKPANLFLTHDVGGAPCIKVLDFGISKSSGVDLTLTQDSQALGSPLYMSPEQMSSSKDVDARSDIWALGIVIYQLVAGITPFHADSIQALCARVLMGTPTPLAELRPDAPPGFEAVVLRCLQRDREKRFDNVAELTAALAPFATPAAIGYVHRVARVLGVAASSTSPPADASPAADAPSVAAAPVASPAGGGEAALPAPVVSTIVMPSRGGAAAGPSIASSPAVQPSYPSADLPVSSAMFSLPGSGVGLVASQGSLVAPALAPTTGSGLTLSSPATQGSSPLLALPVQPAPPRKMPLVLAGAAGALVVVGIAVVALRPWASPATSVAEPAALAISGVPATAPSESAPVIVPVATATALVGPTSSAASTASGTASAPTATSGTTTRPAATAKPSGKPASLPSSRPGVSYDDRR